MRRTFLLGAVALMVVSASGFEATAQPDDRKTVRGFLANDKQSGPATTFSADVLNIYLFWKGERLQAGDEIRVVWIAENIGEVGLKQGKIGERSVTVSKPDQDGSFFVSRPRDRVWPVGQYRTEIYIGKNLVRALGFTIQPGVNVEVR